MTWFYFNGHNGHVKLVYSRMVHDLEFIFRKRRDRNDDDGRRRRSNGTIIQYKDLTSITLQAIYSPWSYRVSKALKALPLSAESGKLSARNCNSSTERNDDQSSMLSMSGLLYLKPAC